MEKFHKTIIIVALPAERTTIETNRPASPRINKIIALWDECRGTANIFRAIFFFFFAFHSFCAPLRVSCEKCTSIAARSLSTAKGNHQRRIWMMRSCSAFSLHFVWYCCGRRFQFYSTFEFCIFGIAYQFSLASEAKPYRFHRNWINWIFFTRNCNWWNIAGMVGAHMSRWRKMKQQHGNETQNQIFSVFRRRCENEPLNRWLVAMRGANRQRCTIEHLITSNGGVTLGPQKLLNYRRCNGNGVGAAMSKLNIFVIYRTYAILSKIWWLSMQLLRSVLASGRISWAHRRSAIYEAMREPIWKT